MELFNLGTRMVIYAFIPEIEQVHPEKKAPSLKIDHLIILYMQILTLQFKDNSDPMKIVRI